MKEKIKSWIKNFLLDEQEDFAPKKFSAPKATSFTIKTGDIDKEIVCVCTEWPNGEGYDFVMGDNKFVSLHLDEVELFIACLNDLNYFG